MKNMQWKKKATPPSGREFLPLKDKILPLFFLLFCFCGVGLWGQDLPQCQVHLLEKSKLTRLESLNKQNLSDFQFSRLDQDIAVFRYTGPTGTFESSDQAPLNFQIRQELTAAFYQYFGDNYDYIVFFTDFDYISNAIAFANIIRNNVDGIGLPIFDESTNFSSQHRLSSLIELGNISKYMDGDTLDWVRFNEVVLHELGHSWLAYIAYDKGGGQPSQSLLKGDDFSHWSYLFDSDASFLYGHDWFEVSSNHYQSRSIRNTYSDLDLYLMGFLPSDQVNEMTLLHSNEIPDSPDLFPENAAEIQTSSVETVDISQIIESNGMRVPGYSLAPKSFRVAFLFLWSQDAPSSTVTSAIQDALVPLNAFFIGKTRDLGHLDFKADIVSTKGIGQDIPTAISFLQSKMGPDHLWADHASTKVRDSIQVIRALEQQGLDVSQSINALRAFEDRQLDDTARIARFFSERNQVDLARIKKIIDSQNPDGGFSLGGHYESSYLDTVLALEALTSGYHDDYSQPIQLGILWLLQQKNDKDYWRTTIGSDEPSLFTTLKVLDFLSNQKIDEGQDIQATISQSLDWVLGFQGSQGVIGQSFSDYDATVMALKVLLRQGILNSKIIDYLEHSQSESGAWNETVFDTALVLNGLRFADINGLADLRIDPNSITWSPEVLIVNQPTTVKVLLENLGNASCEDVVVRLFKNPPETGGVEVAQAQLDVPLEPGQSKWAEMVWPTTNVDSDFELFIVAETSSQDAVPENNRTSLLFSWEGVDPYIQEGSFNISNERPIQGETIQMSLKVANAGSAESSGFDIECWLDDPDSGGTLLDTQTVGLLAPNDVPVDVHFEWEATAPVGYHNLFFQIVSAEDARPENNQYQHTIEVLVAVSGFDVGIEAASLSLSPSQFQTCPQDFALHATLVDHGHTQPQDMLLELFFGSISENHVLFSMPASMQDSTLPVSLPFSIDTLGDFPLFIRVSPPEGTADVRPENNVRTFTLAGIHLEDFEIVPGSTIASPLIAGQPVSLSTQVLNRNVSPRPQVPVKFWFNDGTGPVLLGLVHVNLPGNGQAQANLSWDSPESPVSGEIIAMVDPDNTYLELEEGDNSESIPCTTTSSDLPNLNIQTADMELLNQPYGESGAFSMNVTYRNNGGSQLDSGELNVYLDHTDNPPLVGPLPISVLASGASRTELITIDPLDFRGDHGIIVTLSTIEEESNLADNLAFKSIHVSGGPNATFGPTPLELNPSWPENGSVVNVDVWLNNTGETSADNLKICLYQNSSGGPILDEKTIDLDPGTSHEVFSFTMDVSISELVCVLDPQNLIVEQNEEDNSTAINLIARVGDVAVSRKVFSPNGDKVKDNVTLFWDRPESNLDIQIKNSKGQIKRKWAGLAGTGSLVWDGSDTENKTLPDGLYLIQWMDSITKYRLADTAVQIDNNQFLIRDSFSFSNPQFVDLFPENTFGVDSWLAWAKDSSIVYGAIPSGPPVAVSADAKFVKELWDAQGQSVFTLLNYPGYLLSQGGPFGLEDSCTVLGPGGAFLQSFQVDFFANGERILDWIDLQHVLVLSESQNSLSIYDFHQDTSQPIELPNRAWGNIADSFLSQGSIFILESNEFDGELTHSIHKVDVQTGEVELYRDFSEYGQVEAVETLARQGEFWVIGLKNSVWANQDVLFFDLKKGSQAAWSQIHGTTFPHNEDFYSDARLYRSPIDSGVPEVSVLVDWVSGHRYLVRDENLKFLQGLISPNGSRTAVGGYSDFGLFTTYQNLALVFEAFNVNGNGVRLQGTATDLNFSSWEVSYATIAQPDNWIPTGIQGDFRRINGYLGTWIPENPGAYLLKCTVSDQAGNQREKVVLTAVEGANPFYNSSLDTFFISPNGDGVKDEVFLSFEVRTPFEGHFSVYDETGNNIKYINQFFGVAGFATISWDGTNDQQQIVGNGTYRINFNGFDYWVTVDLNAPDVDFQFLKTERRDHPEGYYTVVTRLVTYYDMSVDDYFLESWALERRWTNNSEWTEIRSSGTPYTTNFLEPDYFDTLDQVLHSEFKLTARDLAGNKTVWTGAAEIEPLVWTLRSGKEEFVQAGRLGYTTPGGIQALTFVAALPPERFPITFTGLVIDDNLVVDPIAKQVQWDGNPISPGISRVNLPTNEQVFSFRARFTDALGQEYLTEMLQTIDIDFQIELDWIEPRKGTSGYDIHLKLLDSFLPTSDTPTDHFAMGQVVGSFDESIVFESPIAFGPSFKNGWPDADECKYKYPSSELVTTWNDPSPKLWQDNEFLIKDLVLFPGTIDEMEVGDTYTEHFCPKVIVSFRPQKKCNQNFQVAYFNPSGKKTLIGTVGNIQFFADSNGMQPISEVIDLSDPDPFLIDFSKFVQGEWNSIFAVIQNQVGENYPISPGGADENRIAFILNEAIPGIGAKVQKVSEFFSTGRMPEILFPDQVLCSPSLRERKIYRKCPKSRMFSPILRDLNIGLKDPMKFVPYFMWDPIIDIWAHPIDNPYRVVNLRTHCLSYDLPQIDIGLLLEHGEIEPEWQVYLEYVNEIGNCDVVAARVSFSDSGLPTSTNLRMVLNSKKVVNPFSSELEGQFVFELDTWAMVSAWIETFDSGQTVAVLEPGADYPKGLNILSWDGRNQAGELVADGTYRCVVYTQTFCGEGKQASQLVEFDNEPPQIVIHQPGEGTVELPSPIVISASDWHPLSRIRVSLYPEGLPEESVLLKEIEYPPFFDQETIANLQFQEPGRYTLRVLGTDIADNESVEEVSFEVTSNALISSFVLSETWISPNSDGVKDGCQIHLGLLNPATVNLYLTDGTHQYSLLDQEYQTSADFDYYFDGTIQGTPIPDGDYSVVFEAQSGGTQSRTALLHVDTQLPYIDLSEPDIYTVFSEFPLRVVGTIYDSGQLTSWQLSLHVNDQNSDLANGNGPVDASPIGEISNVPEGTHQIVLSAEDRAGNSRTKSFPLRIDLTPPLLQLSRPLPQELFDGNQELIVSGTFVETNPKSIRFDLYKDGQEVFNLGSLESNELSNSEFYFEYSGADLPDGTFELRVQMDDLANHSSHTGVPITIDRQPPVAILSPFSHGGLVSGPASIRGTAKDISLSYYEIGLRSLFAKRDGDGFDTLFRGTQSKENEELYFWSILPPDGNYEIRLKAEDQFGRVSEDVQSIFVDATPPASPHQLSAQTSYYGAAPNKKARVQLSWDAATDADLMGYYVYRNGILLTPEPLVQQTYYDDDPVPDGTWLYQVQSVDLAGNKSTDLPQAEVILDTTAPAPFIASPSSGDVLGGIVSIYGSIFDERLSSWSLALGEGTMPSTWTPLAHGNQNISFDLLYQWVTVSLNPGPYQLRLRASDTFGNVGNFSIQVQIENTPPSQPGKPVVELGSFDLRVSWEPNSEPDISHYKVYRNGQYVDDSEWSVFFDEVPDGIYSYQVLAVDNAGNQSPLSLPSDPFTLDLHDPKAYFVTPQDGDRFEDTLVIEAQTLENDIQSVIFKYRPQGNPTWVDIIVDAEQPWSTKWDASVLSDGYYELSLVAVEGGSGDLDPSPPVIVVEKGDTTGPEQVQNLTARQLRDRLVLTWDENVEPDLSSYRVFQNGVKVQDITLNTTEILGLGSGTWEFKIAAVDQSGNQGPFSESIDVTRFSPNLAQDSLLIDEDGFSIYGKGDVTFPIVKAFEGEIELAQSQLDDSGEFNIDGVISQSGVHELSIIQMDDSGQESLPSDFYLVRAEVPESAGDFIANGDGQDPENVVLNWTQPGIQVVGYQVLKDSSGIQGESFCDFSSIIVSSGDPDLMVDNDVSTVWYSEGAPQEQIEIHLTQPGLLKGLELHFHPDFSLPSEAVVEFMVLGHWIPIWKFPCDLTADLNTLDLGLTTRPMWSDGIRLTLNSDGHPIALGELRLIQHTLLPDDQLDYVDVDPGIGRFEYALKTWNFYGLDNQTPTQIVGIGDYSAPLPPDQLTGIVQGSDILLSWNLSASDDVAFYRVFREDRILTDVVDGEYLDLDLHSGSYTYFVCAVDLAGNISAPSNSIELEVQNGVNERPQLSAVFDSQTGTIRLRWDYDQNEDFFSYRVFKNVNAGPWSQLSSSTLEPWNSKQYSDLPLEDIGAELGYKVAAVDLNGSEFFSDPVVLDQPLLAPEFVCPPEGGGQKVYSDHVFITGYSQPGTVVKVSKNLTYDQDVSVLNRQHSDKVLEIASEPLSIAGDLEGHYVAVSPQNLHQLVIHDLQNQSEVDFTVNDHGHSLSFSPDGTKLAYIDRNETGISGYMRVLNISKLELETDISLPGVSGPLVWIDDYHLLFVQGNQMNQINLLDGKIATQYTAEAEVIHSFCVTNKANGFLIQQEVQGLFQLVWVHNGSVELKFEMEESFQWSYRAPGHDIFLATLDGHLSVLKLDAQFNNIFNDPFSLGYLSDFASLIGTSQRGKDFIVGTTGGNLERWHWDGVDLTFSGSFAEPNQAFASCQSPGGDFWTAYFNDGVFGLYHIQEKGSFKVGIDKLLVGTNTVSAVAVDLATQTLSKPSGILKLDYSLENLADLHISNDDLSTLPTICQLGREVLVIANIQNTGPVDAENVSILWSLEKPDGSKVDYEDAPIPLVPSNQVLSVAHTIPSETLLPGIHQFEVVLDSENSIPEQLESNNRAEVYFLVSESIGLDLEVLLEKESLEALEDLVFTAVLGNTGAPLESLRVEPRIETSDGTQLATLPPQMIPTLATNGVVDLNFSFPTSHFLADSYRLVVSIFHDSDLLLDRAVEWTLHPDLSLSAEFFSVPQTVELGDPIQGSFKISNDSLNYFRTQLSAKLELKQSGTLMRDLEVPITSLLPRQSVEVPFDLATGSFEEGLYQLHLSVFENNQLIRYAICDLQLLFREIYALGASLYLDPLQVKSGENFKAQYFLKNSGNMPLDLDLDFALKNSQGLEAKSQSVNMHLDSGTDQNGLVVFETEGLEPGIYDVSMSNQNQSGSVVSVSKHGLLEIVANQIPALLITGIPENFITNSEVTIHVVVEDDDLPLPVPELSLNQMPYLMDTPITEDGDYSFVAYAVDSQGQDVEQNERFRIDTTAPIVSVNNIQPGQSFTNGVTPDINVFDASLVLTEYQLDGETYVLNSPVEDEGSHVLEIWATDFFGLETHEQVPFTINSGGDIIHLTGAVQGESYNHAITVGVEVDPGASIDFFQVNGVEQSPPFSITEEGDYLVHARATLGAVTQDAMLGFQIDLTDPAIVVLGVENHHHYKHAVYPLILIDGKRDNNANILLNGQPYESGLRVDKEQFHQLSIAAQDLAGNSSSMSLDFILDFTPPQWTVIGVADNQVYQDTLVATWSADDDYLSQSSAILNGEPVASPLQIINSGQYKLDLVASDVAGNIASESIQFAVDGVEPIIVITGVEDGEIRNTPATITIEVFDNNRAMFQSYLNGHPFASGSMVYLEGDYHLFVDAMGSNGSPLTRELDFVIDKTPPSISVTGVVEGGYYYEPVMPGFDVQDNHPGSARSKLNGVQFIQGTPIASWGIYGLEIIATDLAGNQAQKNVNFTLGDQPDIYINIRGVENNSYYSDSVTPEIQIIADPLTASTIKLNGIDYSSGTPVSNEGSYLLQVEAISNSKSDSRTLSFVIDKTAPEILVAGVESGQTYHHAVVPQITIEETWPKEQAFLLDGSPFVSGTQVLSPGAHTLFLTAIDLAGNRTERQIEFSLSAFDDLVVEPDPLTFSHAASPYDLSFKVFNNLPEEIQIIDVSFEGPAMDLFSLVDLSGETMNPGGFALGTIHFEPVESGNFSAEVVFTTDSASFPEVRLPLIGERLRMDLHLAPQAQAPMVLVGTSQTTSLVVHDDGEAVTELMNLNMTGAEEYQSITSLPLTIEPGSSQPIGFNFQPNHPGRFYSEVSLHTDDSLNSEYKGYLCGRGYWVFDWACVPQSFDLGPFDLYADSNNWLLYDDRSLYMSSDTPNDPTYTLNLPPQFNPRLVLTGPKGLPHFFDEDGGLYQLSKSGLKFVSCSLPVQDACWDEIRHSFIWVDQTATLWYLSMDGNMTQLVLPPEFTSAQTLCVDPVTGDIVLPNNSGSLYRLANGSKDLQLWIEDSHLVDIKKLIAGENELFALKNHEILAISQSGSVSSLATYSEQIKGIAYRNGELLTTLENAPQLLRVSNGTMVPIWQSPRSDWSSIACSEAGEDLFFLDADQGQIEHANVASNDVSLLIQDSKLAPCTHLAFGTNLYGYDPSVGLYRIDINTGAIFLMGQPGLGAIDSLVIQTQSVGNDLIFAAVDSAIYQITETGTSNFVVTLPGRIADLHDIPGDTQFVQVLIDRHVYNVNVSNQTFVEAYSLPQAASTFYPESSTQSVYIYKSALYRHTPDHEQVLAGPGPIKGGHLIGKNSKTQSVWLFDSSSSDLIRLEPRSVLVSQWLKKPVELSNDTNHNQSLEVLDLIWAVNATHHLEEQSLLVEPKRGFSEKKGK